MVKSNKTIEYYPLILPPRTFWNIDLSLSRSDVPKLCQGLHSIIHEKNGACFYYPDIKAIKTDCRYEWQIPYQGRKFGLKLGIRFSIDNNDLKSIEVFVAYGDESDKFGEPPSFSQRELEKFHQIFLDIIREALFRSKPESKKYYHIIFHIEIPPFKRVAEPIKLEEFNLTIFPTVIIKKDTKRVSAVAVSVKESSVPVAKAAALREVTILCALLTLANGALFKTIHIDWPKNRKPIETIDNLDPLPKNESLYPYRRWIVCNDEIDFEFRDRIENIMRIYHNLSDSEQTKLLDSIFAYYAGKEIQNKQPTLATVSFMAALSPFRNVKQCTGTVKCTKCGLLRSPDGSNFHHFLTGDRVSLFNSLCKIFKINQGAKNYNELNILLTNIYNRHRSAFVHEATLRHGEYYKDYNLPAALPAENLPYSELLIYRQDLHSFERIVRRALLELLAKKAGVSLNYKILKLDIRIRTSTAFEISISLPAKIPVGIKMKPTEHIKKVKKE